MSAFISPPLAPSSAPSPSRSALPLPLSDTLTLYSSSTATQWRGASPRLDPFNQNVFHSFICLQGQNYHEYTDLHTDHHVSESTVLLKYFVVQETGMFHRSSCPYLSVHKPRSKTPIPPFPTDSHACARLPSNHHPLSQTDLFLEISIERHSFIMHSQRFSFIAKGMWACQTRVNSPNSRGRVYI